MATEEITKVEIVAAKNDKRVADIEVRVGDERPFKPNSNGDVLYKSNSLCAKFSGPGVTDSTTHV